MMKMSDVNERLAIYKILSDAKHSQAYYSLLSSFSFRLGRERRIHPNTVENVVATLANIRPAKGKRGKADRARRWQWLDQKLMEDERLNLLPEYSSEKKRRVSNKDFYKSQEWREIRYRVLSRSKGKCELCNRGSQNGVILHVDHIKPRSKYPELALSERNLQVLCDDCNLGKSNIDDTDWR